jgi:hypothetical protein
MWACRMLVWRVSYYADGVRVVGFATETKLHVAHRPSQGSGRYRQTANYRRTTTRRSTPITSLLARSYPEPVLANGSVRQAVPVGSGLRSAAGSCRLRRSPTVPVPYDSVTWQRDTMLPLTMMPLWVTPDWMSKLLCVRSIGADSHGSRSVAKFLTLPNSRRRGSVTLCGHWRGGCGLPWCQRRGAVGGCGLCALYVVTG